MAYTGTSQWNPTTSSYGNKEQVDSTGLTPKQIDMSTAANPMNNNAKNNVLPKDVAPEQKKPKAVPQAADKEQQEATRAEVNKMRSTIGTAAYSVQGLVNKFLKEGSAQAGLKDKSQMKWVVDSNGVGSFKYADGGDAQYDLDAVVQEKLGQQSALKQAAAPFYTQDPTGKWKSKSLEEYVTTQPTYSKLDPNKKQQVDSLMGIASTINEYEARGQGGSAEAQALREQLQALDKNGIVTGMYKAIEDYQKFAGKAGTQGEGALKWYGDEGDTGMGIVDILNMDQKRIEEEVNKAMTTSGGIFGGDYEAGLKRQVDTESAEAKAGQQQEIQYRNELVKASEIFFKDSQEKLMQNSTAIKAAFDGSVKNILDQLGGDNSPQAKATKAFLTQLSASDPKDFAELINEMLTNPDTGIGTEQRKLLRSMLGSFTGETEDPGMIQDWINELARSGSVTIEGKPIELNAEQKYNVLTALKSGNTEEVKKVMQQALGISKVGDLLKEAETKTAPGDIQGQVNAFANSLVNSMKDFAGSQTEAAVIAKLGIDKKVWDSLNQNAKYEKFAEVLNANPNLLFTSVEQSASDLMSTTQLALEEADKNMAGYENDFGDQITTIDNAIRELRASQGNMPTVASAYIQDVYSRAWQAGSQKYGEFFGRNGQMFLNQGYKQSDLDNATNALGNRDVYLELKRVSPELYNAMMMGSPKVRNFVEAQSSVAIKMALDDPQYRDFTESYIKAFIRNEGGALAKVVNTVPAFKTKDAQLNAYISQLEGRRNEVVQNQAQLATKKEVIKNIRSGSSKLLSPEKIIQESINLGKKLTNGKIDFGPAFKTMTKESATQLGTDTAEIGSRKVSSDIGQYQFNSKPGALELAGPGLEEADFTKVLLEILGPGAADTNKEFTELPRISLPSFNWNYN